ncbi:MAG: acetyl-CoA carboxylase biotin carboxyl carrier protein [Candidatus Izimaplasma sp.]|nr:acetyl-CoA carboxylase biotin carboxyl carrier protein [Candidatus Izimaplasma bacterium]
MDLRQIKNILKEFENSTVHRLELSNDEFSLKLEKEAKTNNNINSSFEPEVRSEVATKEVALQTPQDEGNTNVLVTAPLVGTFYNSPSPDSSPFVSLNQQINKGDTLCIVEAMKVMNEIPAPVSGKVVKIITQDASMVEYGEVLMEIEV